PPEKQHGDDRGRHRAHDRENPQQRQADAEDQKPAPVVDDLCSNSHIQSLDLAHGLASPLAKGATSAVPVVKVTLRYILFGSALERKLVRETAGSSRAFSADRRCPRRPQCKRVDTRRLSCRVLIRRCTHRFAAVAVEIAQARPVAAGASFYYIKSEKELAA